MTELVDAFRAMDTDKVIQLALEHRSSDIYENDTDYTLLSLAIEFIEDENTRTEIIEFLVKNGQDIDEQFGETETTVLINACREGDLQLAEFLLNLGADVCATDRNGWQGIHHAAEYTDNVDIVKLLVKYGADPEAQLPEDTEDCLEYDGPGRKPIDIAVGSGSDNVAKYLLEEVGVKPHTFEDEDEEDEEDGEDDE